MISIQHACQVNSVASISAGKAPSPMHFDCLENSRHISKEIYRRFKLNGHIKIFNSHCWSTKLYSLHVILSLSGSIRWRIFPGLSLFLSHQLMNIGYQSWLFPLSIKGISYSSSLKMKMDDVRLLRPQKWKIYEIYDITRQWHLGTSYTADNNNSYSLKTNG